MVKDDRKLCNICAWREFCKKKFKIGNKLHCPDYTRDETIKNNNSKKENKKN
jgi:hypothetical protein